MDRLRSQLRAASEPPSLEVAYEGMGVKPVGAENFDALAAEMHSSDREG